MVGSLITRGFMMIMAIVTAVERLADVIISWLPLYGEVKLAFIVYLWYPKTKGATYVYSTFLRPFVAQHEPEIDRNMMELRAKARDIASKHWQWVATYLQSQFIELLHYLASQSPKPHGFPQDFPPIFRVDTN